MNKHLFDKIYSFVVRFAGLLVMTILPFPVLAQTNPYVVSFETGETHPAVKSYAATDTVWADSIPWVMPGVYLGTMTVSDFVNGNHAARFRLSNNTGGAPAYMKMLEDLPNGIQKIEFYAAMYGSDVGGSLLVSYSTDSGQTWVSSGDTIWVTASHDSAMKVSVEPAINQAVRMKIEKAEGSDSRIDVDDISISRYGTGKYVLIKEQTPEGDGVSIDTDSLEIYFDHPVVAVQGNLSLFRSGGGVQQITIPSAQVSVHDSMAVVSGIQLQDNSQYYVLLSDSAFTDTLNQLFSVGISDSTFWQFHTEDTVVAPGMMPLTQLSESFLACNEAQNLMGVFRAFNVEGNQTWQCTSEGHGDSFAVAISGGFGKDVSAHNQDWLISVLPFDLSAQTEPVLSFWQKGLYEGNVLRSVRISTDYSGIGNPVSDSVHWLELNIPGINAAPASQWNLMDGIDLSAFQNQLFYLAFTYSCATDGAYKLFYDDIKIQSPTAVLSIIPKSFSVTVLGIPIDGVLHLEFNSVSAQKLQLVIYNLQGQRLLHQSLRISEGTSRSSLPLSVVASGIYLLRVTNQRESALVRFFLP